MILDSTPVISWRIDVSCGVQKSVFAHIVSGDVIVVACMRSININRVDFWIAVWILVERWQLRQLLGKAVYSFIGRHG